MWNLWQEYDEVPPYLERERARQFRQWLSAVDGALQRECRQLRAGLPIYLHKSAIMQELEQNQVLIISAEPGSGKTTQIPQYLYDFNALSLGRLQDMKKDVLEGRKQSTGLFRLPQQRVVCTQPRRMAVRCSAERVQQEFAGETGEEGVVSYRMRGERSEPRISRLPPSIVYLTDGLLIFEIAKDLKPYSAVVLDEVKFLIFHQ